MPVNNAQFYGMGKGAAQVIDTTSGAQQQFGQLLAKQQQHRQLELKQLTDQQAQLKPGALRNDDELNDFLKYQQDWRNKSISAINEADPYKKAQAQSAADMAYQTANNFVAKSKQQQMQDQSIQNDLNNPLKRYEYAPDAVNQFVQHQGMSVANPKFNKNLGMSLQAAPDIDYFTKTTKGVNDDLIKGAISKDEITPSVKDKDGNIITPAMQVSVKRIDPMADNGLAHQIANRASVVNGVPVDPKYFMALKSRNADLFQNVNSDNDLHMAVNLAAAREAHNGQLMQSGNSSAYNIPNAPETDKQRLALFKQEQLYRQQHPTYAQGQANLPTPLQQNYVEPMRNGGVPELNHFLSLADKGQFRATEKPSASVVNGYHVIHIPDQVTVDQKIAKENAKAKADYDANPDKTGFPLFTKNRQVIPYEQSDAYKANPPADQYKVVKPAEDVSLDPNNKVDYYAKAGTVTNRLHIPVGEVNNMAGGKGGRGVIPTTTTNSAVPKVDKGMVKVTVGGKTGQIPADKYGQFIKENPTAKKIDE